MKSVSKKIGLLGFAANPPHNGHLEIAKLLLKKKLVDEVWLIPCFKHSFGKPLASSHHRWQMARILERKRIKASKVEFFRKGKSYTVDTVKILQEKYPDYRFFWVMGSDIVQSGSFLRWKNWKTLSSLVDFLVVLRKGHEIKKMHSGFTLVEGEISGISSTEIRERIRRGFSIKGLVPPKIKEYIEKHKLYKGS